MMIALSDPDVEVCSVHDDCQREEAIHKWHLSKQAGYDRGEEAVKHWVANHWHEYLRAKWIEHLEGTRFWMELDRNDFGLLRTHFQDQHVLLTPILSMLKNCQENLDVIVWSTLRKQVPEPVLKILEDLDINSRRLLHRFEIAA
ncbi:hypothetical protein BH11PLA2_BH11PLA2_03670 [soil metagenome]